MMARRIRIIPFDMKYLEDYYKHFNEEITKYQWPDPFENLEDARNMLQGNELRRKRVKKYEQL